MLDKIKNKLLLTTLLSILALGLILRIYHLAENPSGFFCDEASNGYDAYSILTTGKDQHGVTFPIFFQSLDDFRGGLAIYSATPSILLFGLNEFSTRLPSAIYGLIEIIIIFFIAKEFSKNKKNYLGLTAALITATMPWLIHYNRIGFEFTVYVTLFSAMILLLLKSIHKTSFIIPAFIIAALTLYTYQPAKLLVPLFLAGFILIHKKTYLFHKKYTLAGIFAFFILSIPIILSLLNGTGLARFNSVSILSSSLPLQETIMLLIQNYLVQLSPAYLFTSGEPTPITRHFVGGLTPLLSITLPFLLIGIIHTLLTLKNNKNSQLLLYWLLLYPIAGAITASAPFTARSIIGAPLFAILISIGIITTISHTKKFIPSRYLSAAIIILLLTNLTLFAKFYFVQYPLYSSDYWGWQYGPKNIITYFTQNENNYDDLIMIPEFNAPHIFFKFYAPNNCNKCRLGTPDNSYIPDRKQLFAITPTYMTNNPNYTYLPIKNIYYPNGNIAFILTEIKKNQ